MSKLLKVKVFRFDSFLDEHSGYKIYEVPAEVGMSAMDVLDYIYQNLDSTIAYYDHAACSLGICGRCTGKVNGKPGLLCQTPIHEQEEIILEPIKMTGIVKDLVVERGKGPNRPREKERDHRG